MSRPKAYKGNEPYLFVSYSHKDDARVWPMIEGLQKRGLRVWYDEGIEWGSHWDDVIFEHLSGCAYVVAFVTDHFLQSENCQDEISYAKDEQKGPFIVFLDNLELTGKMKFRYGRLQALNLHQFSGMDALLDTLVQTRSLATCLGADIQIVPQQPVYSDEDPETYYRKAKALGDEKKDAEAFVWYRKAAEQGHMDAQCDLGYCYINGKGVSKDEKEAVKWYQKAADQGNMDAQCNLGYCYFHGKGVSKDEAEGIKWYRKAAEQGHADAQNWLGDYYYSDGWGNSEDDAEAARWYRMAAEQGHAAAQWSLGCCYITGSGVSVNHTEAFRWFCKAAEQGHAHAQLSLGACYDKGWGVDSDATEAVRWYRKSAEQECADAQYYLGSCYSNGWGVAQDEAEAVKWYRKAAKQGDEYAQKALTDRGLTW